MTITRSTLSDEEAKFVEEWESVTPTKQYVWKLNFRGEEVSTLVAPDSKFTISTEERVMTQAKIARSQLDPFTNGCFRPIRVPEEINIETNPNALAKSDILRIFKASSRAWSEYMSVIDSPATLERMIELGKDSDDLSSKRFHELEERLVEVKPKKRVTSKALDDFDKAGSPSQTGSGRRKSSSAKPSHSSSS